MNTLLDWIAPVFILTVLHLLYPDWWFFNNLLIITISRGTEIPNAVRWSLAGYIDSLYLTYNGRQCFYRISIYFGIPVAIRILIFSCYATGAVLDWVWRHGIIVCSTASCLLSLWILVRVRWRKKIKHWSLQVLQWALMFAVPNLVYGILLVSRIVLEQTKTAGILLDNMLRSSSPVFSYAEAPKFDPNTQFRLLRIQRKIPFLPVSAELISCDMESNPSYHAISYAWAHGPQDDRTIICNGMRLLVKGNVYDILQHCSSFYKPQVIWIDTVCIDQANPKEKTIQVRKMQEIYSRAAHVLVCLGSEAADLANSLILELRNMHQQFGDTIFARHVVDFLKRQKTDIYLRARIRALRDLAYHPWFRRVWVVQEVVVARQVTVCYSRHGVPWSDFNEHWKSLQRLIGTFFTLLSTDTDNTLSINAFSAGSPNLGIMSLPLIAAQRLDYHCYGPQRISRLLQIFAAREATVPVDKVFALLGMARNYSTDLRRLIDYENMTEDDQSINMLLNLANFLVDNQEAMDVLSFAGIGSHGHNSDLPSWVVDWTKERTETPLFPYFVRPTVQYCATRSMPFSMIRASSRRQVTVRGHVIDEIHSIASLPLPSATETTLDPTMAALTPYPTTALQHARQYIQDPYEHGIDQPLEEAVWRTLIGDRTHSHRPAPPIYGASFFERFECIQDAAQIARSHRAANIFADSIYEELHAKWGTERILQFAKEARIFEEIDHLFDHAKGSNPLVFATTKKEYIGMVPAMSRVGDVEDEGDVVCLLYGMHVPCVMRKHEGNWQLVGAAYIHGLMDGEGLDLGLEEREFTLV
jgi:hypothetical protein